MSALNCCGLCRNYKDEDSDNGRCTENKDSQNRGWLMRFNDAPCIKFKSFNETKEEKEMNEPFDTLDSTTQKFVMNVCEELHITENEFKEQGGYAILTLYIMFDGKVSIPEWVKRT